MKNFPRDLFSTPPIAPDYCEDAPHYADTVPKDTVLTEEDGFKNVWTCPKCSRKFIMCEDWQTWKRSE